MRRRLRSFLFVPGVRPDRFASAAASGADAVVFDLEDSVDPARKSEARAAIGEWLRSPAAAPARPRRAGPRQCDDDVLPSGTARSSQRRAERLFHDDLTFVRDLSSLAGVVLPKTESADDA